MEFNYVEEVVIRDALNKERSLSLTEYYTVSCNDNKRAIAFINIEEYNTLETLKAALLAFKIKHKERGTKYVW